MIWRNPIAWLGLATLVVPIAIHLLVRQRAALTPFPSLQFIRPSRLASVRRRLISDWSLLLARLAMLALVVAALADPLWQSPSRRAQWSSRYARAIVVDASPSAASGERRAQQETASAFRSATFEATDLSDGIRRAIHWLLTALPARRELVVISDFQIGALEAAMLRAVPGHVGMRFVRAGDTPATRTADGLPQTRRAARGFDAHTPRVTVTSRDTSVSWLSAGPVSGRDRTGARDVRVVVDPSSRDVRLHPFGVRLHGSVDDRPALLAAAEAVLAQGVPVGAGLAGSAKEHESAIYPATITVMPEPGALELPSGAIRLTAPWMGDVLDRIATDATLARGVGRATIDERFAMEVPAPWLIVLRDRRGRPALIAAAADATKSRSESESELLLVSRVKASDEATALLLRSTLRALAGPDPLLEAEVLAVPDAQLARWQRRATDPPPSEWQHVESGDRRWLWAGALLLLVVEQFIRRQHDSHAERRQPPVVPSSAGPRAACRLRALRYGAPRRA
jgi:Aerotolerance regulator N-terminal